jgi:hypothetical protein
LRQCLRRLRVNFCVLSAACLLMTGCNPFKHKKPDATKGVVTGIVICADTGKPARFATVMLTPAPKAETKTEDKQDEAEPLPPAETTITDLDGRFRLEAVQPGRYYAFATLEGYLDPTLGLDPDRLSAKSSDHERSVDAVAQWRDHLTPVSVGVHRESNANLVIQRAAEISGTIAFDDGSPAIGMHFQLYRKAEKNSWVAVGFSRLDSWTLQTLSDGHGRFTISNLTAGEYTLCALMPSEAESAAPRICYGGTFRRKGAKTVKVAQGEAFAGADIEIPLAGMHTVTGSVAALPDGHAVTNGMVRLLFDDDRDKARETTIDDDGTYTFAYVPEGHYILQVSGAHDEEPAAADASDSSGTTEKPAVTHTYADKEMPINVIGDNEVNVSVAPVGAASQLGVSTSGGTAAPSVAPVANPTPQ